VFHTVLKIDRCRVPEFINRLIFVMEMKCVSCEVRTEFYMLFTTNFVEPVVMNNLYHIIEHTVSSLVVLFGSRTLAPPDTARALSS
jgi:hypothetical protein